MYDDNQLMKQVQTGDKSAFEAIVLRYRLSAIQFANSFVFDIFAAEDIVQDCFIKIYLNRMNYEFSHTFKTFLFTIVRNKSIDYLRKNKAQRLVNLDSIHEIEELNSQEDIFLKKEMSNRIFKILKSLKDDYKTALYLFAIEEMSYKEIAKIMQKTIPQIKITIFRARKKLKKLFEGDDICEK